MHPTTERESSSYVPLASEGAHAACQNCAATLTGPYCAKCGQENLSSDLTLREFLRETTKELLQWDGKIPSTLRALIARPGFLTREFLEGRQVRWLKPLRVYLICSVAYFLSGPLVDAVTDREERAIARMTVRQADGRVTFTPDERRKLEQALPARIFGIERVDRVAGNFEAFNRSVNTAYPKAMFILLPLFALFTFALWYRQLPRYPAHLYLALHLHAAWFAGFTVSSLIGGVTPWIAVAATLEAVVTIWVVSYGLATFRHVFGQSWPSTAAKGAIIAVVYAAVLFAVSIALLGLALLRLGR